MTIDQLTENQRRVLSTSSPNPKDALDGYMTAIDRALMDSAAATEKALAERYPGHSFTFSHGTRQGFWGLGSDKLITFSVRDDAAGDDGTVFTHCVDGVYDFYDTFYCHAHEKELNRLVESLLARGGLDDVRSCLSLRSPVHYSVEPDLPIGDYLRQGSQSMNGCIYLGRTCETDAETLTELLRGCGIVGPLNIHRVIVWPEGKITAALARTEPEYIDQTISILLQ